MRRKEREIEDLSTIETIIRTAPVCRMGMVDGDRPYVVPMSFGYAPGVIYLHSAAAGRKIDILRINPHVCLEFEGHCTLIRNKTACGFGMRYESVIAFGKVRFLDDPMLKRRALDSIMQHYTEGSFDYPDEALSKTCLLQVDIESMTGKCS